MFMRLRTRALAALAGAATALVAVAAAAGPASAAVVDVVDPGSITFQKDVENPAPIDGQLVSGQNFALAFDYDATGTAVAPGDSFALELPVEFQIRAASWTLVDSVSGDPVGDCTATPAAGGTAAAVTCTFSDYAASHEDISGHVVVRAFADKETDSSTVSFVIDGSVTLVTLPGGGGIGPNPGNTSEAPPEPYKWGTVTDADPNVVTWVFGFPTDASTTPPVIRDTLPEGWTWVGTQPRLGVMDKADWPGRYTYLAPGDGWDYTIAGKTLTITFTAVNPDSIYRIDTDSRPDGAVSWEPGDTVSNTATVDDVVVDYTVRKATEGSGSGTGTGFGGFTLTKRVDDASGLVPADQTYAFTATITAPSGEVVTREMTLTGGESSTVTGLHAGSTVSIVEASPVDGAGYTWRSPVWAIEDMTSGGAATFTVAGGATTAVGFLNVAVPAQIETSTPPPTDPPTTDPSTGPTTDAPTSGTPSGSTAAPTTPGPELPNTGADVDPAVLAAVAATLLAGVGLLVARRRIAARGR